MIIDELLLVSRIHALKRVKFAFEISFKIIAGLDNFLHDIGSLFFGYAWPKWEFSKIASNTDSCGYDELSIFFVKRWSIQSCSIHIRCMSRIGLVSVVVFFNDGIEELVE